MNVPLSLEWVPMFVHSTNRALLGDIYAWDLLEEGDPLRRILHLQLNRWWRKEEIPIIRSLLSQWAEVNDCVYRRSHWKKWNFKALIIMKGLGPRQNLSPFEVQCAHRRIG